MTNDVTNESIESFYSAEWCQTKQKEVEQELWINALSEDLERVAEFDPRPFGDVRESEAKTYYSSSLKRWVQAESFQIDPLVKQPPEEVSAAEAFTPDPGYAGYDFRPHLLDPKTGDFILCDSGSQVSAWPPDPGDKPLKNVILKAVNGTKIQCFGYKTVEIKIGRKSYDVKVIKAQVESPVLGWDFIRQKKVDFRWNDNEEIT